ncbi:hypothetical protein EI94DRAFT_1756731 [Lactarius quietus]|nr:hypothetical protein EI94DRAFT_1756731 [Lactarius quietus]
MATPATSKSPSDFGDDDAAKDEHPREEDDEEDDEGPVTPPPVKLSNKGKDRKSAVLSGGVQKKVHVSSVYQKMSSREKRQLRNKISARNFRNRRKEYITTLEGDVAERDRLIDAIRTELGSTSSPLHRWRADSPVLPPPGPLPITPPASTSWGSSSTSPLLTPNTQKDLPATASPRLAAKAFWGGSSTAIGGITPVHTVTIPDLIAGAALKPALQENINPALNNNNNPTAYRMQLWTRMAQQQQHHQLAQQQQQQQHPSPHQSPASQPTSALTTFHPHKPSAPPPPHHPSYPTPPASPQPGAQMPTPQHAALATMASQTLVQRLGSAFWQAFSGSSPPSSSSAQNARAPAWDAEKVRRVLEGTAVVRVVDVEPPSSVPSATETVVPVKETKEVQTQTPTPCDTGLSVLEESMRALTLGKK